MGNPAIEKALWTAAFELAAQRPWREITLQEIVQKAGIDLVQASAVISSKSGILRLFAREMDQAFLAALSGDPLEGQPHDRMFDAMLRRIELLTPYKEALRSIAADPADSPADRLAMLWSAMLSQNWIVMAAGTETPGLRGDLQRLGLAKIYGDVLKVWLEDDDAGLARTMAALDRKLREASAFAKRMETPIAIISGLARAARAFNQPDRKEQSSANATAD